MRPIASIAVAALLVVAATCVRAEPAAIPFVGCPSDGQQGPQPPPEKPEHMPTVPGPAAARLAYYASGDLAVLAPRGWRCFGLYGSSGSLLIVAPRPLDHDLLDADAGLKGPAVQLSFSEGDTSGRFEAAEIAARLFPGRKRFVDEVAAEGIEAGRRYARGPYPHDVVRHIGPDVAEFTTPAHRKGMGTQSRLAPDADPIDGVAIMTPNNDAIALDVRLPAAERDLARPIIEAVRARRWEGP